MARDDILVYATRDPRGRMTFDEVERWLAQTLAGRCESAWLFGSWRTERFGPESDIDLMIVARTDEGFVERGMRYFDLRERLPAIGILVYTPDEWERLTTNPTAGFWRSVVASLRRVV